MYVINISEVRTIMYSEEPRDRIELLFQMLQEVLSDLDIIKIDLKKLKGERQ